MTDNTGTLYYVGDPCYAMTPDEWNEALGLYWDDNFEPFYTMEDGRQFTMSRTDFGDGVAIDEANWSYASDSGLLGIIRANHINRECMPTVKTLIEMKGARFVRIDEPTVQAVIEAGKSPLGEEVYSDEDFIVIDEII
jgi:hypothetical protein